MGALREQEYRSPFLQWYERTTVRKNVIASVREEEVGGKVFFPIDLVPMCKHPLILERGPEMEREVQIQRFYSYTRFTAMLERRAVNPGTLLVADECIGVDLPQSMVEDADKIYTEEAWHAQHANTIGNEVKSVTGVKPISLDEPQFLTRLNALLADQNRTEQEQSLLFFTIVSETLISALLAQIPHNTMVVDGVRAYVADHAADEGRHHKYFSSLLKYVWPSLPQNQQDFIGPMIPKFVRWFLEPDLHSSRKLLISKGFSPKQQERILCETFVPSEINEGIRHSARHSLTYFEQVGILDNPHALEAFVSEGLLSV